MPRSPDFLPVSCLSEVEDGGGLPGAAFDVDAVHVTGGYANLRNTSFKAIRGVVVGVAIGVV